MINLKIRRGAVLCLLLLLSNNVVKADDANSSESWFRKFWNSIVGGTGTNADGTINIDATMYPFIVKKFDPEKLNAFRQLMGQPTNNNDTNLKLSVLKELGERGVYVSPTYFAKFPQSQGVEGYNAIDNYIKVFGKDTSVHGSDKLVQELKQQFNTENLATATTLATELQDPAQRERWIKLAEHVRNKDLLGVAEYLTNSKDNLPASLQKLSSMAEQKEYLTALEKMSKIYDTVMRDQRVTTVGLEGPEGSDFSELRSRIDLEHAKLLKNETNLNDAEKSRLEELVNKFKSKKDLLELQSLVEKAGKHLKYKKEGNEVYFYDNATSSALSAQLMHMNEEDRKTFVKRMKEAADMVNTTLGEGEEALLKALIDLKIAEPAKVYTNSQNGNNRDEQLPQKIRELQGLKYEGGYNYQINGGWYISDDMRTRFEIEGGIANQGLAATVKNPSRNTSDVLKAVVGSEPQSSLTSSTVNVSVKSLIASIYRDIDLNGGMLGAYLGVGAGMAQISLDKNHGLPLALNESESTFISPVVKIGAGINLNIDDEERIQLYGGYEGTYLIDSAAIFGVDHPPLTFRNHGVKAGLRIKIGTGSYVGGAVTKILAS